MALPFGIYAIVVNNIIKINRFIQEKRKGLLSDTAKGFLLFLNKKRKDNVEPQRHCIYSGKKKIIVGHISKKKNSKQPTKKPHQYKTSAAANESKDTTPLNSMQRYDFFPTWQSKSEFILRRLLNTVFYIQTN